MTVLFFKPDGVISTNNMAPGRSMLGFTQQFLHSYITHTGILLPSESKEYNQVLL